MRTTTDLATVRRRPRLFTWGNVIEIHDVGPYSFIEASSDDVTSFHVYVDGEDTCNSCSTLDSALVFAIAHKNISSVNDARHMASAAIKVLSVK